VKLKMHFVLFLFFISLHGQADTGFESELKAYIDFGTSANIERLGQGLIAELEKRKSKHSYCEYQEYERDALKPIGDGRASNHIILKCDGFSDLGIRFGFSPSGKYRIFGYWSVKA